MKKTIIILQMPKEAAQRLLKKFNDSPKAVKKAFKTFGLLDIQISKNEQTKKI